MRARGAHSAFTLLELLIVTVLLSVVATAVIPTIIARRSTHDLRGAAAQFEKELNALRIEALQSGEAQTLIYFPHSSRYRLEAPTPTNRELDGAIEFRDDQADSVAGRRILFYPDGGAEPAAFRLTSRSGEQVDIRIERLTGTPRISRVYRP